MHLDMNKYYLKKIIILLLENINICVIIDFVRSKRGSSMNYINGDTFLANVFLTLIERKKLEIGLNELIKFEYNYLQLLDGENNILENSVENIMNFVNTYQEYLEVVEDGNTKHIYISNEDDFAYVLLEEFEKNLKDAKKYRKALKMIINDEKKSA